MKHVASLAGQTQAAQIYKSCVLGLRGCIQEASCQEVRDNFIACAVRPSLHANFPWAGLAIVLAAVPAGALKACLGVALRSQLAPHIQFRPIKRLASNRWTPSLGLCSSGSVLEGHLAETFDQVPHRVQKHHCANNPVNIVNMSGPNWTMSKILQTWRGSLSQGLKGTRKCPRI